MLFVYLFQKRNCFKKIEIQFFLLFVILFIFSPMAYLYISLTQTDKRTDYPGKKISQVVQENWDNTFTNKIENGRRR